MIANVLDGTKIWLVFNIGNLWHFIIHQNVCQIKQKSVMLKEMGWNLTWAKNVAVKRFAIQNTNFLKGSWDIVSLSK